MPLATTTFAGEAAKSRSLLVSQHDEITTNIQASFTASSSMMRALEPLPFDTTTGKEEFLIGEASSSLAVVSPPPSLSNIRKNIKPEESQPSSFHLDAACKIVFNGNGDEGLDGRDGFDAENFFMEQVGSEELFDYPMFPPSSWATDINTTSPNGTSTISDSLFNEHGTTIAADTGGPLDVVGNGGAVVTRQNDMSSSSATTAKAIKNPKSNNPLLQTATSYSPSQQDTISPSAVGRSWYQRYQELVLFQNEYGHCCVPVNWHQNPRLAQWVKRQRSQFKLRQEGRHSNMSDSRIEALDVLNFVWDSHSVFWNKRLNELQAFVETNGHCNVPTKYPPNQELAVWAKSQRRQFKLFCQGGDTKSHITTERIEKLLKLGFVFNPREHQKSQPKRTTIVPKTA